MVLLLAACALPADTDTSPTSPHGDDTAEVATGSKVSIETVDREHDGDTPVELTVPEHATLLRVEACSQGEETVCGVWAGDYKLYDDGRLVLEPSSWDGSSVRVTWLKIE